MAGKQLGKSDDRHLWPEMFRVIQECKPTWVVGENVTGLIELALEDCFVDLETEGYEVQPLIIPACAVGAIHRRDRVWILAHSQRNRLQGKLQQDCGNQDQSLKTLPSHEICENKEQLPTPYIIGGNDGVSKGLHRTARIKALGNSIVPQVAYQILQGIVDIEEGGNPCR